MTTKLEWLRRSIDRTRLALDQALSAGDRLALLRELARLSGGRVDLSSEGLGLWPSEEPLLPRFRLRPTDGGRGLRLDDDDLDEIAPGLGSSLRCDPDARTVFVEALADAALRRASAHDAYKSETQRAAVGAMLTMPEAASMMVSMPTGSGKSLLFQLGPVWWRRSNPGACAIVITPTIALAEDHARTLAGIAGLEGSRCLTGDMGAAARTQVLDAFRRGEVPVLLLSPETAFGAARDALIDASSAPEVKFGLAGRLVAVFVDEAHVVESWGRSFRPDFQRLPGLVEALRSRSPGLRTILLSATLGDAARRTLRQAYGHGEWLEIHARVPRYDFDVVVAPFATAQARDEALLTAIDVVPRPAIVYVTRVAHAEALHARLVAERGYERVALFTGELEDPSERRRIIKDWAADRLDLVVATSAFGLGVDKASVRSVIHACLPESPSRWYQEVGRASRDGHQGLSITLWTPNGPGMASSDEADALRMATSSWLTRDLAEARWQALAAGAVASWDRDRRRLKLPLDAAREGLDRRTGERNRRWNRSLLALMQRAGALRVDSVGESERGPLSWDVVLLDDALFARGPELAAAWDRIFAVRQAEVTEAAKEFRSFARLMSGQRRGCLMSGIFESIEPGERPPECGRCPDCRRSGARPPVRLSAGGLERGWPRRSARAALPEGLVLLRPSDVESQDGVSALVRRLADVGIEQYVLPDAWAEAAASRLATSSARFGFVFRQSEWIEPDRAWQDLPTAVLVGSSDDVAAGLARSREFVGTHPGQTLVLAANPSREVARRPLSQVASQMAAYDEASLDDFLATTSNGARP